MGSPGATGVKPYQKDMLKAAIETIGQCDISVHGQSMKPFIRDGDTVTICRKSSGLFPGRVVAFFNGDQLVVHRIIWMKKVSGKGKLLRVWGDSSLHSLGKVWSCKIIGMVTHISRHDKKHDLWLRFPFSMCAVLVGIFIHGVFLLRKLPYKNTGTGEGWPPDFHDH
jgi:hypothetical protein